MAEDRMRLIFHHLSPSYTPAVHAASVINPVKAAQIQSSSREFSGKQKKSKQKFRFTNNMGKLTLQQRLFYEENGFVVIPKLVSESDIERFQHRFEDIANRKVHIPGLTVMKEISYAKNSLNEKVVYKLQDFIYDEVLFEYCKLPQILDYVESFCGPNIKAMHTMLINKPPDSGSLSSRHPLHQDLHYFPFRPADKIVCAWTAMEPVHRANGCLVAIPGTHKSELLPHNYPDWEGGVNKLYHGVTNMDKDCMEKRAHLEMDTGDTVFFHPLLIHGSGANRTDGFRKAISCHYAASECHYISIKGTSQQIVADEILEIAKQKNIEVDDESVAFFFQYRGRLVRGKEANL